MKINGFLIVPIFLVCTIAWSGEEKVIEMKDVPKSIMEKAKEVMPDAQFVSANTETEDDGTMVYEIQGKLSDGRKIEVDIFPDNSVEEIEVEFTHDLVPGAVLNAIEKKLPGFKPTYIEASHSESNKVVQYEFEGEFGEMKMDLDVSADGRTIVVSDK